MEKIIITKEEFLSYKEVQKSGKTNMFDINNVIYLSNIPLTKEKIMEIMKHYMDYVEKFIIKEIKIS